MRTIGKIWQPLTAELLEKLNLTKRQIYKRIEKGDWYDGFVVRKGKNTNRWRFFCVEDWQKWEQLDHYQAA